MAQEPNRFEPFVDFDTDGAAFQVGLQHYAVGGPGPAIRINTGALEIQFRAHSTDVDALIDGFKQARKQLRQRAKSAATTLQR